MSQKIGFITGVSPSANPFFSGLRGRSARLRRLGARLCAVIGFGLWAIVPAHADGTFNINTGVNTGSGFTFSGGVLTINDNGTYTINGSGQTGNRIVVQSGVTASITLNNVNINVSGTEDAIAFDMSGANVALTLTGKNTLRSGKYQAGLHVPDGAVLEIIAGSLDTYGGEHGAGIGGGGSITISGGTVAAYGGKHAAGIGGNNTGGGGTITIRGGTVSASTSGTAAGIGGGSLGGGGTITISGGTVTVNSGPTGTGIGAGYMGSGGSITISGGSIKASSFSSQPTSDGSTPVYLNTLTVGASAVVNRAVTAGRIGSAACTQDGLGGYGIKDVKTDGGGKVYFYLPASSAETVKLTAGGSSYAASYVRATNTGNTQTLAAMTQSMTLSVSATETFAPATYGYITAPSPLSVTVTNTGSATISGLNATLSGTGASGFTLSSLSAASMTASGGTVSFTVTPKTGLNAGTYTAAVTVTTTDAGISDISFEVDFTVGKAAPSASLLDYTLPVSPVTYDGAEKSVAVAKQASVVGLGTTITVKYNGSTTKPVNAGTYAVTVDLDEGTNYTAAAGLGLGNFTIGKKAITITGGTVTPKTYDGTTAATVSALTFDGLVSPDNNSNFALDTDYEITAAAFDNANVGTGKTVTFTAALKSTTKAGNYNLTNGLNYNLTNQAIGKAALTAAHLAYDLSAVTYTDKPQGIAPPRLKSPLAGGNITVKYNGGTTAPVNAGTYAVTVDVANVANYADIAGLSLGDFVINRAVPTAEYLDFTLPDIIYDGEFHSVPVTPKEGVVGLGDITVRYNGHTGRPDEDGAYTVTVEIAGNDNYEAVTLSLGAFAIYRPPVPEIRRTVTLAPSPYYDIVPAPGIYGIASGRDMVLTLTPLATLPAGHVPQVTTGRRILADDEGGITVESNADGTYTVHIHRIQETTAVTVTATAVSSGVTSSGSLPAARVWSYGKQLFITATVSGRAQVYNAAGRLVKVLSTVAGETVTQSLPPGIYLIATEGKSYRVVITE